MPQIKHAAGHLLLPIRCVNVAPLSCAEFTRTVARKYREQKWFLAFENDVARLCGRPPSERRRNEEGKPGEIANTVAVDDKTNGCHQVSCKIPGKEVGSLFVAKLAKASYCNEQRKRGRLFGAPGRQWRVER